MKATTTKLFLLALAIFTIGCESMAYKSASKTNTVEALTQFLEKHPDSEFAAEARAKIETLEFEAAKKTDSIETYEQYLKKYPESGFADEIKSRIKTLPFENARKINTIEGYERFLQEYPDSKFAGEARSLTTKFVRLTINWNSEIELNKT